jgi:hypothetical protein
MPQSVRAAASGADSRCGGAQLLVGTSAGAWANAERAVARAKEQDDRDIVDSLWQD